MCVWGGHKGCTRPRVQRCHQCRAGAAAARLQVWEGAQGRTQPRGQRLQPHLQPRLRGACRRVELRFQPRLPPRPQVCKQLFGINDDNYYTVSTAVAGIMMGM